MAGDRLTDLAAVRIDVLPFRRLRLDTELVDLGAKDDGSAASRSTGDAVVPVELKPTCASMAGDVRGLKNSSVIP